MTIDFFVLPIQIAGILCRDLHLFGDFRVADRRPERRHAHELCVVQFRATQQIHQWLNAVWSVVAEANRYFAGEAPWALAKTDPARQHTVLYVTAEVIRQIAILTQPVMPAASERLLDSLGIPQGEARMFAALGGHTRIAPGTVLPAPQAVFPRYIEPSAA